MGPTKLDANDLFVDEDPDLDTNDIFLDYDPDDMQKMQAAELFSDNDPDALIEKSNKAKNIWGENTTENRAARGQVIKDYFTAPTKTPQEIDAMSVWEKIEYAKQLEKEFEYRRSKGFSKGIASSLTFGGSEYIPGLEPEEDDMMFGWGQAVGSILPIEGIYSLVGRPLVKLAVKSKYAKDAITAFARMTGFGLTGATYESITDIVKTGEAPSVEDVVTHGAKWALLDGVLQAVGKGISFANKLYKVTQNNKNLKAQEVVNDVIKQLAKEKINPEINPEQYAQRAEEILDSKIPIEQRGDIEPEVKELIDKIKEPEAVKEAKASEVTKEKKTKKAETKTETTKEPIKSDLPETVRLRKPEDIKVGFENGKSTASVSFEKEGAFYPHKIKLTLEEKALIDASNSWDKAGDYKEGADYADKARELIYKRLVEEPKPQSKTESKVPKEKVKEKKSETLQESKAEGIKQTFEDLGKGISEKFYEQSWEALQKGETKIGGIKDPFLDAAKVNVDKGLIKSKADLKKFGDVYFKAKKTPTSEAKVEVKPTKPAELSAKAPKVEPKKPKKSEKPAKQEAKKPKEKPKPEPVHVDIPEEDLGKTPSEILGKHVQTGKPKKEFKLPSIKQVADVVETKLYNRFAPLKALGEGEASIFNKPRELAEQVKGFASKVQSTLRNAQYDAATQEVIGPAFEKIFLPERLKQLTGKNKLDRAEFDKYLFAKTSLERQKIGHKSAMPTKAGEAFIRENNAKYEPLAKDIYKFGRNQINNLVHEGLVSKEGAERMFDLYKSHAPLYRVMPEELTLAERIAEGLTGKTPSDKAALTPGASNLKVKKPLHRAKGSEKVSKSPTESIVKNSYAFENAIMKNRVMKATGRGLEKQGYKVTEIGKPKQSNEQIAEALGMDLEDLEAMVDDIDAVGEAINFLNPEQPRGKLRWFEDGKLFEVNAPKDIIESVEGLSPEQANFVMKALTSWKNAFSLGTVLQPGTLMRLSGMDLMISTLQSKYPKWNALMEFPTRVLYEYPRMLFNILKKGELFQDYLQSGAAQVSMQGLDRQMLESMTDTLTNAMKRKNTLLKDTLMSPITAGKKILSGLRKTSETLGDVPRLLEFERSYEAAIKKGASKKEAMAQAAFDAFEVSVPYGRKGSSKSLQTLYNIFPFVNTVVNSNVSLAKALNPKNPLFRSVVATGLSYLTIPTMAAYLKNRDDPRYQALPQEDKDRNVYVYTTDDPNEEPWKFRKFWQYGYLFQTLPEHIAEFIIQKDPKAFDGLLKSFEYEFSPFTMMSISSAFSDGKFDPMKLFEAGRYSLIPERQKKIEAELQSTSSTSETAKKLAKYMKISPIYIDYIVNKTGGGLGRDVIRLSDEFIYQTGQSIDKRPAKQAADSIFFGTWYGRGPSKRNEYVNKFYEYVDKFETMKNTATALRKEGRDEEADKMMENYYNVSKMRKNFAKYYKEIERIRNEHPDDLNGEEKRAELNNIYREFTDLAKEYVEIIEEDTKGNK